MTTHLLLGKLALLFTLGALLIVGAPSRSVAAAIVQTQTIPDGDTPWNQYVTFNKFNQQDGELTSLKVTVTTWISVSISIHNPAGAMIFGTVNSHAMGLIQDELGYFGNTSQIDFYVPEDPVTYFVEPFQFYYFGTFERTFDFVLNSVDAAILSEFSSSGAGATTKLNYSLRTEIDSNVFGDFVMPTTAGATLTLEYSYTPVPEPSTLSLASGACAFAVLVFHMRRRRSPSQLV